MSPFIASAGRAAARASPLPPPAKAGWRFSGLKESRKSGPSSRPDRACNHASFAREPTHPTLTQARGLAAGAWRGAPTPSRPSAERGGLDGVRRRLPETSAPMVSCAAGFSEPSGSLKPSCSGGAHLRPFDRTPSTAPSPIGSDRNGTGSSRRRAPPSTWAHVHSLATHPLPACLSPPHPRSFSRRRLGRRFSCPGARCLLCLTGLHRDCTQLSISAPLLTTAGALAARCVQLRWR